jgi:protein-S-isoprenylcysteine O-methyltransferase Ste14
VRVLAIIAMIPAAATIYFAAFWFWFERWRRHPGLTYAFMFATIGGFAAAVIELRDHLLAYTVDVPRPAVVLGWALIVVSFVVGIVADRQLGMRVRAFVPFFEQAGRIELRTTGAYAIVRHPIYASGIWFQAGVFLATGYVAVAAACLVFTLGAVWFTRQEERRLVELLEHPDEYARYRERVGALFPKLTR